MPKPQFERAAGVVYTKPWVVDLMLDVVGYDQTDDLGAQTIIEPGCGEGAFLARIVPRLLASAEAHGRPLPSLANAIRGYELDPDAAERARVTVIEILQRSGASSQVARQLAHEWIVTSDFLLMEVDVKASWVVGNPPYVRVEEADPQIYSRYRERWTTMSGRADIYIGFFEAGLSMLSENGRLCFICADRWMHNQYGAGLRRQVLEDYSLALVLELHHSDVFEVAVAAYPAITVIARNRQTATVLATAKPSFGAESASGFRDWFTTEEKIDVVEGDFSGAMLDGSFRADESWPSGPPERLRLIADLEARFPALTDVGVSIGVGIATGADKVYVVTGDQGVEAELLRPAVGPADVRTGVVEWAGRQIISPWRGRDLIDLAGYPGARAYFHARASILKGRYVAKRNPEAWWRTIDRPPADDYRGDKLIVADINDRIEPVLDSSGYWPLHSAYYITSVIWDLEALGGYLLSDTAGAFVEAYSVKMANGHLRISAQYLKKIRVPQFADVSETDRRALVDAFRKRDRVRATDVVQRITAD